MQISLKMIDGGGPQAKQNYLLAPSPEHVTRWIAIWAVDQRMAALNCMFGQTGSKQKRKKENVKKNLFFFPKRKNAIFKIKI